MELTQDEYALFTGDNTTYNSEDWSLIVEEASERLASFLCLEALPDELPTPLKNLLSNFIFAVRQHQGAGVDEVESKNVRNFTIKFRNNSAANVFAQLARNYADIIDKYSQCGSGIDVEKSKHYCCGDSTIIISGRRGWYDRF